MSIDLNPVLATGLADLFNTFREIFSTPTTLLADKMAKLYSSSMTGDTTGEFDLSGFEDTNLFSAINTLLSNSPYPGLKQTIPQAKSLLDGFDTASYGYEELLSQLYTKREDVISDTFKAKLTSTFMDSVVTGSGIKNIDIDLFDDSANSLKTAFSNLLSFINTQVSTKMNQIPETAMATKTEGLYSKFGNSADALVKSVFGGDTLQRMYSAYSNIINTGTVSTDVMEDLFNGTTGVFSTIINKVVSELSMINDEILTYIQTSVVDDAVDAFETKEETKLTADLARSKARLASQGGLNESSMMLTDAIMRRDIERRVADYRSALQMRLFEAFHQYSIQRQALMTQSYANKYQQDVATKTCVILQMLNTLFQSINQSIVSNFGYLNSRVEDYVNKDSRLFEMMGQNINAYNLQQVATELQFRANISGAILQSVQQDKALKQQEYQIVSDLNRQLYLANYDEFKANTDFTLKDAMLNLDALMYGYNGMASVNGQVIQLGKTNTISSMVSGAISGGAAGASFGHPELGAIAGAVGGLLKDVG